MDAVNVLRHLIFVVIGNHHSMAARVSMNCGSVIVEVILFVEVLRAPEGLEPEPEHIERSHARGDEADEPGKLANGAV